MSDKVPSPRTDPRAAIITAASGLLAEGGGRAVTTRAVAERAGVQAPTIYRLFGDKDGLIEALAESAMAAYAASKQQDGPSTLRDPVDALRNAWQRHVDFGLANPELYVLIGGRARQHRSPAIVSGIEVLRRHIRGMASAGLLRVSERRALDMVHAAGNGAVLALIEQSPEQRDAGLPDAMFDAVLAAIATAPVAAVRGDALAMAVHLDSLIDDLPTLSSAERGLLHEWMSRAIAHEESVSASV